MINLEVIKNLKPCIDRLDNYVKHYKDKTFTKQQFMGLKHITHEDKIWVAVRLIPKHNLRFAAADIAESVLHIYEKQYPNDKRPRKAIEAARSKEVDKNTINDDAAAYAAAAQAAYSAYHDSTANYTDAYAAHAAAYAAANAVANVAADAARAAADAYSATTVDDKLKQQKLIRKICLKYWK